MSSASQLFSTRRSRGNRETPPSHRPNHHNISNAVNHIPVDAYDHHNQSHDALRRPISRSHRALRHVVVDHPTCDISVAAVATTPPLSPLLTEHLNASSNAGTYDLITSSNREAGTANNRIHDLQIGRNDRLPGNVMLARARLLERLGGTLSTRTRQRGITSDTSRGTHAVSGAISGDDFTYLDTDYSSLSLEQQAYRKPRGLSSEIINSLSREIFRSQKYEDGTRQVSPECTICLEIFAEGDCLILLPCDHRFHRSCLVPWVRSQGDCPNCRAFIRRDAATQCHHQGAA